MKQAPVAWRITELNYVTMNQQMAESWVAFGFNAVPLFESPRELSDEEIEELREYHGINDWLYETSVPDFARAILKKASEK